ncbi:MAG TPA: nucleoside-diphosphate kinase [Sphingomonas sp.]|nr:nucleoside-diphosphate kinase [Sphingomonas sp.]
MSVAFRRESDDEHLEPKFELPLPPGPNLVTARGLALIEAKVTELEAAPTEAMAQEDRARLLRELRYWRTRQATAQLMPAPSDDEAEPTLGRLAFSAPLARAMMGAYPGERVAFAGKADTIEVVSTGAIPA